LASFGGLLRVRAGGVQSTLLGMNEISQQDSAAATSTASPESAGTAASPATRTSPESAASSAAGLKAPGGELLDGVATHELFASGEASAVELLEEAIAWADRLKPELNAIIGRLDDAARQAAQRLDATRGSGAASGSLAGVPFLTKDLTCTTEGQPYHAGNTALKDAGYVASSTAHLSGCAHRRVGQCGRYRADAD